MSAWTTTPITDVHQGHNGEIEVAGDEAKARWNLGYATYDPRTRGFRLLASFYHDRYRRTADGWRFDRPPLRGSETPPAS